MQVIVYGKHLDIGEALRLYVEDAIERNVRKFFDHAIRAHVTISKQHHVFKTDIVVNEGTGTGVVMKSNSEDSEPYRSFDIAITKIASRLRKYKTRIKNHHKKSENVYLEGVKYTIASDLEDDGQFPVIIAEKSWEIEKMSVADAVMYMDLKDLPAYMFINNQTDAPDVVYYRKDGNISWISGTKAVSKI